MRFFKWLFKDAETKVETPQGEVVTGTAATLANLVRIAQEERSRKADEWWRTVKHDYLQEVIEECRELAKKEIRQHSIWIRGHEGYWFPEFKDMLRKEGFIVKDGYCETYITISW